MGQGLGPATENPKDEGNTAAAPKRLIVFKGRLQQEKHMMASQKTKEAFRASRLAEGRIGWLSAAGIGQQTVSENRRTRLCWGSHWSTSKTEES